MVQVAFTAPHELASKSGLNILQQGGTAIEAMVAAAASISVVYPHMTGMGGDGFWLIQKPGEEPYAINAAGCSAQAATLDFYREEKQIPCRGGRAALTVAGAVSGWHHALSWAEENLDAQVNLEQLFEEAIGFAEQGVEVTESLAQASDAKLAELLCVDGYKTTFLNDLKPLKKGEIFKQPGQARLLRKLAENGLLDFYHGEIAQTIATALEASGSPIRVQDFHDYKADVMEVLTCDVSFGTLYNLGAPTQGLASLVILGLYDRLYQPGWNEEQKIHHLVECTKQAFMLRDRLITDPQRISVNLSDYLTEDFLRSLTHKVTADKALHWPYVAQPGDTVWMGAIDQNGVMVSYIQSLYWEFGCGVTIPEYGLVWNNRGVGFSLDASHLNALSPKMKPFHTLNPAMCVFDDGRRMVYGTMGGEGQPQTQAAILSRYVYEGLSPKVAVAEPRWLLGRTWGDAQNNLKVEESLYARLVDDFKAKGHDLESVADHSEMMGHAGMLVLDVSGEIECASDPRSDGQAYSIEIRND